MIDVSVIIVSYNTLQLTKNCLLSIFKQTNGLKLEVIVSDNGSTDGSVEMIKSDFPSVILIENNQNLGFGKANNQGLKIAKGKYIFYLNSDTILLNNAIKFFYDFWEANKELLIGALGCQLVDEKYRPIHSGGEFPTIESIKKENLEILRRHNKYSILKRFHLMWLISLYSKLINKDDKINFNNSYTNIDYITGADLFLLNNEDAYYDEEFFLYYEETDLQKRISRKGKKAYLITEPKIIHFVNKNKKSRNITSFSTIQSQISSIKYAKKHCSGNLEEVRNIIKKDWDLPEVRKEIEKFQNIKSINFNLE